MGRAAISRPAGDHPVVKQVATARWQLTQREFGPWVRGYRKAQGRERQCVQLATLSWYALDERSGPASRTWTRPTSPAPRHSRATRVTTRAAPQRSPADGRAAGREAPQLPSHRQGDRQRPRSRGLNRPRLRHHHRLPANRHRTPTTSRRSPLPRREPIAPPATTEQTSSGARGQLRPPPVPRLPAVPPPVGRAGRGGGPCPLRSVAGPDRGAGNGDPADPTMHPIQPQQ